MTFDHRPCARGCTVHRRHLAACEDPEQCRGCQPRTAEHGFLCYGCHSRLTNLLEVAAGQVTLLEVMAGLKGEVELTSVTTAKIRTAWRTDSSQDFRTLYAHGTIAAHQASEPLRVACVDSMQEIRDRLSLWVMHLVNDYLIDDPADDVETMCAFLIRHLDRLEHREAIGDELEQWCEVMSTAHTLAPWREQVAHLRGIPCPECHATTLAMFGGDSDVTCLRCRATMPHARYAVWTKMLAIKHQEGAGDPHHDGGGSDAVAHAVRGPQDGRAG